jgi:hypothetical protein
VAAGGFSRTQLSRFRSSDRINLLVVVVGALAALYILTGTFAAAVLLPALAAVGVEGVLRAHPAARLREPGAIATQALLPAAFVLALALFFRYATTGYWGVVGALATTVAFALLVYAQYALLDVDGAARDAGRTVQIAAAHAGLFALLGVLYAYDFAPLAAALLAGAAAAVFAIEPLREADLDWRDLLIYTLAAGFFLAQVRFGLGYARLDGLLAALFLTLAFYAGLGLLSAALTKRLDRRVWVEYGVVAAVGLTVVIAGQALV